MKGIITRRITESIARRNKVSFIRDFNFPELGNRNAAIDPVTIASFSGEKQMADQLYSMASFYINVGKPEKWIIFSDGSHSSSSKEIFNDIPGVELVDLSKSILPLEYSKETNPLLKKIFYYQTVEIKSTTIFVDSDVLFYKKFIDFLPLLRKNNWFLVDEYYGALDKSYTDEVKFDTYPCNSGFFIFNKELNWQYVMDYLNSQMHKKEGLQLWSEQTAFHVLTRDFSNFLPLDPRYFVVEGSDSFKYRSDFDYDKIALRHFVGPIRHKMWQYSWKKVLGFN